MYSYQEALEKSLVYFGDDELAAKVFIDKYALRDENQQLLELTPTDMHWRLAKEFARIEKNKFKAPLTEEEIFGFFDRFQYLVPQGSPMAGIGNNAQITSISNCFVTESPTDSYGGVLKTDQQLVQISKRRGGVGTDLSNLRPSNTPTRNAARTSTGITSWMERYSNSIREVGQGGRRGALMLTLSVHHPDIEKFITIKNDDKKVTGANISVRLTDEFLKALEKDEEYEQCFPINYKEKKIKPLFSKMVKASTVWKLIINSAWLRAEPGILFWDKITTYNAVDCYVSHGFTTTSTNPCSEIGLCQFDSCRLLLINLFSFVNNPFTKEAKFDWVKFDKYTKIAQRLMDDLIDLELEKIEAILVKIKSDPENKEVKVEELYIWEEIKNKCLLGRRTGLGVTAEGDMLAALGIKYGSPESIIHVDKVHEYMKIASFQSSVDLAKELGTFPIWDWKTEKDSEFLLQIKKTHPSLYKDIEKHGRRNIANLTIAPAGSVSILTQTSSGIEPLYTIKPYTRRKKINPNDTNTRVDFKDPSGDCWQEFTVYHPKLKMWMDIIGETDWTKSPWYGCCAEDIDWVSRVKLQAAAQKHIDHAISSTINLPNNVEEEKISEIFTAAWKEGLKGITVYRDGCRTGVLIQNPVDESIKSSPVVKRPKELSCDVYHSTVRGDKFYVVVGLLDNKPYEVFTGENVKNVIPNEVKNGKVIKKARGQYFLTSDELDVQLNDLKKHEDIDALTRLISTSLRHGADVAFVVHQLEKTKGDMQSFAKVTARSLKKYIKDGTEVKGEQCPTCIKEGTLIRESGCVMCRACGWTKCS